MEKITKKAMFGALVNFANGNGMIAETKDGQVEVTMDQLREFAQVAIDQLDAKAAKAKETAAKKKAEADVLMNDVADALGAEFEPISEIAARVTNPDATVAKVTYRLTKLVEAGVAEKTEIKVPGANGKDRKVMGYKLAAVAADEDAE